ncbi:hypothetical protein B5S29_g4560 [[Candida] boidinii]|nr:hypothetical protein B5S29_g4560 [[Candida] boidinii]GME87338.1 unnamed protein product [[Candida] boidinii]
MSDHNEKFMSTFAPKKKKVSHDEETDIKQNGLYMDYNRKILNDIFELNSTRPVKITAVNINGTNNQFRDSFLKSQISPLLNSNNQLNLSDFLKNIDLTTLNFAKSGSISNLTMSVNESSFKSPFNSVNTLELVTTLNILPVKKFFMKVGTNIGNGEGDGYLTLQWKNIFGGAENLSFDTNIASNQIGSKNKSTYLLNYSTPILNNTSYKFDNTIYHCTRTIDYTTFHEQDINGITSKLSTNFNTNLNHTLSFETLLRTMKLSNPKSNSSYRNNALINDYFLYNAGSNFKTSCTYTLNYDTRNSTILPTNGNLFKSSIELCLPIINKNNSYIKSQIDVSNSTNFFENLIILNSNLKIGHIYSLDKNIPIHPMDKFQLGGPNDIRGFKISGLGPKQMGLPIGGDAFIAYGLSCFTKLPFLSKDSNFKFHSFINTGKSISLDNGEDVFKKLILFNKYSGLSCTAGIGLIFAHPMARFELNIGVPILKNPGDDIRKGLQYGIGLSFM